MLGEGQRRAARGTDVVIGIVETHGRSATAELMQGLPVLRRRALVHRAARFTEFDVDAMLARRPEVALIDELAHTNVPGSRNAKRWQDVEELLAAGITVITTVNVQHLESLNDVVEQITGVPQRETVPDEIVRAAQQVELVDMTAEALRRRMAHGHIYPLERVDAALGNYFRVGNLTALRELALLWLADKVDEQLDRYRTAHDITGTWEARERVVVALTGGPEGQTLIRRAARVAERSKGADLLAVHVARTDGLAAAYPANLERQRALVEDLGGTYHQVVGENIPAALLDFARGVNATQLVLGASRRSRLGQLVSAGVAATTTAQSGSIDVHLVTHAEAGTRSSTRHRRTGLPFRRRSAGFALAAGGLPLLCLLLANLRGELRLPSDILIFLAASVAVAFVGGIYPALAAAVVGFLLLNYYFTPPLYRFTIAQRDNLLALVVFLVVALAVATAVEIIARRGAQAATARAEATTLSTISGAVVRGTRPLAALLEQMREAFGQDSVTVLERRASGGAADSERDPASWRIAASAGSPPCATPSDGQASALVRDDLRVVLHGRPLAAADQRIFDAFAAQAAAALHQERLADRAGQADALDRVDRMRTALLSAVSHDLRTPLASAKAAANGLRSMDVVFTAADRDELLATVEESLDALGRLVENLLDMSRLQAGALGMQLAPVSAAEVTAQALAELGPDGAPIRVLIPDELPELRADAALLERVLVNLLGNALRYSPPGEPPRISASAHGERVEIRVIDSGPGIPTQQREQVFQPFQRLGDRNPQTGVGLGLALSRGLTEAMGGNLEPDDTPGGGLTMTVALPRAEPPP
jgi:two-component system sensor histidine kinase KdpD